MSSGHFSSVSIVIGVKVTKTGPSLKKDTLCEKFLLSSFILNINTTSMFSLILSNMFLHYLRPSTFINFSDSQSCHLFYGYRKMTEL